MILSHGARSRIYERLRRLFGAPPSRVQVAALPWRPAGDGIEIMLVTSRGTGRWVLPKGWPEKRETLSTAAQREAHEEAGVVGVVSSRPIGQFYYGKRMPTGLERRCEVQVFPLEVERVADKWPEAKHRKREWLAPHQAASRVLEPDLAELISEFAVNPRQSAA